MWETQMPWSGWITIALGVILGGWLAFDGARAFVVGDYVPPRSGAYAGQLGPWSRLVAAVGFDPRSPAVKAAHVGLGLLWLAAVACLLAGVTWARWLVAGCAVASLWYLPFGTLIGVTILAMVFLSKPRGHGSAEPSAARDPARPFVSGDPNFPGGGPGR
jgi:hypothetical protein